MIFGLEGKSHTSNVTMTKSNLKQHFISFNSHSLPFKYKFNSPYPGLLTFVFTFALYFSSSAAVDVLGHRY